MTDNSRLLPRQSRVSSLLLSPLRCIDSLASLFSLCSDSVHCGRSTFELRFEEQVLDRRCCCFDYCVSSNSVLLPMTPTSRQSLNLKVLDKVRQSLKRGEIDKAVTVFINHLQDKSLDSPTGHHTQQQQLRLSECLKCYTPDAANKSETRFWFELGKFSFNANLLDIATAAFEMACKLAPDDPCLLYHLGVLLERSGKVARAIQTLEASSVAKSSPSSPRHHLHKYYVPALFELGCLYSKLNRLNEACKSFNLIVMQEAGNTAAHVQLSSCLEQQGSFDEAYKAILQAYQLDSSDYSIVRSVNRLCSKIGQTDLSCSDKEKEVKEKERKLNRE